MEWETIFSNNNGAAIIGIIGVATGAVIALISTTVTTFFNNKHQTSDNVNNTNTMKHKRETPCSERAQKNCTSYSINHVINTWLCTRL